MTSPDRVSSLTRVLAEVVGLKDRLLDVPAFSAQKRAAIVKDLFDRGMAELVNVRSYGETARDIHAAKEMIHWPMSVQLVAGNDKKEFRVCRSVCFGVYLQQLLADCESILRHSKATASNESNLLKYSAKLTVSRWPPSLSTLPTCVGMVGRNAAMENLHSMPFQRYIGHSLHMLVFSTKEIEKDYASSVAMLCSLINTLNWIDYAIAFSPSLPTAEDVNAWFGDFWAVTNNGWRYIFARAVDGSLPHKNVICTAPPGVIQTVFTSSGETRQRVASDWDIEGIGKMTSDAINNKLADLVEDSNGPVAPLPIGIWTQFQYSYVTEQNLETEADDVIGVWNYSPYYVPPAYGATSSSKPTL